ncbi:hypothetical protein ABFS83_07G077600 [Erythranthe nasuta]
MEDLGSAKMILGTQIVKNIQCGHWFLSQQSYVDKLLLRYNMHQSKVVSTPMGQQFRVSKSQAPATDEEQRYMSKVHNANAVGSLMYCMIYSRPDLAHAASVISKFMADPGQAHWEALKWTLRYMNGSAEIGLLFKRNNGIEGDAVNGLEDSDYAGSVDTRKSLIRYVFTLFGTALSWKSDLQWVVALSRTEAT